MSNKKNNQKKIILSTVFLSCLITKFINFPVKAEISDFVNCGIEAEYPSQLSRSIELQQFGIRLKIPANYRVIAKTDGSVSIVDNGTFKGLECFAKNPHAVGGSGYDSILIYKSSETFIYSNVYNKFPGKDNVFIVWKTTPLDYEYDTYEHEIKLRLKTPKGLIEIESLSDVRFIGKLSESDDFLQILLDVVRDIEII
ncbi:hypothetical protein PN465_22850 [Nodularia spumigena CS-584]|jgi:hypothetical protein|uniref:hypothetical protein n=1 Tax=Nodularia spumigena TaxID=70799 RepID=UPI0000EAD7C3|nr:hypothetical protein [Nodularia spumigena]AHJ27026.1 hypothetical protein NSP_6780 [Nodularia spumigena CCY9414]EAW47406.1 hypothetical protein N9414_21470 [Nodularia spumigena CCY9414]MDB9385028.1 hypothetical protein [Nodularia spumigena CS-584]